MGLVAGLCGQWNALVATGSLAQGVEVHGTAGDQVADGLATCQGVHQRAQTEDVGGGTHGGFAAQLLGRGELRGTHEPALQRHVPPRDELGYGPGDTPVGDAHVQGVFVEVADQDIRGLEIAMGHADGVSRSERPGDLGSHHQHDAGR